MIVKIKFLEIKSKKTIDTPEALWELLVNGVGTYKTALAALGVEDVTDEKNNKCLRVDMHVVRKSVDDMKIVEFLVAKINIVDTITNKIITSHKVTKQDIDVIKQIYAEARKELT